MTLYDPIPGVPVLTDLVADVDALCAGGRLEREVATANHVFDALREAELGDLERHTEAVFALYCALPAVLSHRLHKVHYAHLLSDRPELDPRQPFYRALHHHREIVYWNARLT